MKPINVDYKQGIMIGFVTLTLALFGILERGEAFLKFINPDKNLLNWRFFIAIVLICILFTWFTINRFWWKDHLELQKQRFETDNLTKKLKILESERLTDIITGIPNTIALQNDLELHLEEKRKKKNYQFIFIDLKNFRGINQNYGFLKANSLLRLIAQSIYQRMRRNEEMYKYPINQDKEESESSFYRVHTGGDEFAFIIEGDQADAIGFANRLVDQFNSLSNKTIEILGKKEELSFYCAITEINPRDSFDEILSNGKECYRLAKEGKGKFNICWHPNSVEYLITKNEPQKLADYEKCRLNFEVMTMKNVET